MPTFTLAFCCCAGLLSNTIIVVRIGDQQRFESDGKEHLRSSIFSLDDRSAFSTVFLDCWFTFTHSLGLGVSRRSAGQSDSLHSTQKVPIRLRRAEEKGIVSSGPCLSISTTDLVTQPLRGSGVAIQGKPLTPLDASYHPITAFNFTLGRINHRLRKTPTLSRVQVPQQAQHGFGQCKPRR
jgi:hypothetical protein